LQKGGEAIKKYAANPKGKWNEAIAQRITKHLLQAIHYLHQNKILHLHVTHENFLLKEDSDESDVVLGGFILSQKEGDNSPVKGGNINYQAPEVLQQAGSGRETDMWSLGVACFLLLTGKLAFYDTNRMKRNLKISKANYTLDASLSENAKKFIASLLVVDRPSRLTAGAALEHPWIKEKAPETQLNHVRPAFSAID